MTSDDFVGVRMVSPIVDVLSMKQALKMSADRDVQAISKWLAARRCQGTDRKKNGDWRMERGTRLT